MNQPKAINHLALAVALALVAGCNVGGVVSGPRPSASPAAKTPGNRGAGVAAGGLTTGAPKPAAGLARLLGPDAVVVNLTGKVKLISDHGGAIISNNSGGILSKVRFTGAGGELISKVRYALMAEAAPEGLLAEADVEFVDGEGKVLVDANGASLRARTDDTGAFRFEGKLPPESLVARVTLWNGGVLMALLPQAKAGARVLEIDTASTLGASWVLERVVAGRKDVLARLPGDEAEALRRDLEAARGRLGTAVPTYRPADSAAATEALSREEAAVAGRLERIKAIMLAGQANLGEGLAAARVSLAGPIGVVGDGAGNLYVLEYVGGRVRRIGPDGAIHRHLGGDPRAASPDGARTEVGMQGPTAALMAPDGTLYVADGLANRVIALSNDRVRVVAGTGERAQGALGGPAAETPLMGPNALALAPDGRLLIGEHTKSNPKPGRILAVRPDGTLGLEAEAPSPEIQIGGLALTADGALWVVDVSADGDDLWRKPPGGAWSRIAGDLAIDDFSRLLALPDGSVALAEEEAGRVLRFAPDGARTVIAGGGAADGDGGPAASARLVTPSGMWLAADGTLYVADNSSGLVRAIAPPLDGTGRIRTVAGTTGISQQGDALAIALNSPGGMALDAQGRLVFSESAGHTVKRLEGNSLSLLAGSTRGFGGDGGPASAASFDSPTGLAYAGGALYVLDVENHRIRRIAPDGTVTTVVGKGMRGYLEATSTPAADVMMRRPVTCAVGPDGRLYWVDNENDQVARLNADGTVEVVAGREHEEGWGGDGGPAVAALLNHPTGLAFDARGRLYVADTGNGRIRRIFGLEGPTAYIETFAGVSLTEALGRLGEFTQPGPRLASDAAFIGITALAFDAAGDLYVAEVGTTRLATLLGDLPIAAMLKALPAHGARILKITGVTGDRPEIRAIAGEGTGVLDAPGTDDSLLSPTGLLVDPAHGLYLMDTGNNAIRLLPNAMLTGR